MKTLLITETGLADDRTMAEILISRLEPEGPDRTALQRIADGAARPGDTEVMHRLTDDFIAIYRRLH
jgi:hypothetical protein